MKNSAIKPKNKGAIGKLLVYAKPYLPVIAVALVFSALQIAATLFAPVIVGRTIDYIIGERNVDFGVIGKNAVILALLLTAAVVAQYLSSLCINFASFRTDSPLSFLNSTSEYNLEFSLFPFATNQISSLRNTSLFIVDKSWDVKIN